MFKPALAVFAAAVIFAAMPPAGAQEAVQAQLDVPFELQFGQSAVIESENIEIRFVSVEEDSRCPSDVVCIWEGRATIQVFVQAEDMEYEPLLSVGADASPSATFGPYEIRLAGLEPYPESTSQIDAEDYVAGLVVSKLPANSAGVFVRAAGTEDGRSIAVISGWNLERGKGTLVMLVRDENGTSMSVARFAAGISLCAHGGARECVSGQVVQTAGTAFSPGDVVQLGVLDDTLLFRGGDWQYVLDIKNIKTRLHGPTVELAEGDREGPLLVQEIGSDYVSGLNYPEYPIAVSEGLPITLHVGDSASNGCTITLKLLEIKQDTAVFSRTVDYNRPCPICFHNE